MNHARPSDPSPRRASRRRLPTLPPSAKAIALAAALLAPFSQPAHAQTGGATQPVFVENLGQWDARALFGVKQLHMQFFATRDGFAVTLVDRAPREASSSGRRQRARVDAAPSHEPNRLSSLLVSFEGASADAAVRGGTELPGTHGFYVGKDPDRWASLRRALPRHRHGHAPGPRDGGVRPAGGPGGRPIMETSDLATRTVPAGRLGRAERPHQGIGNRVIEATGEIGAGPVECTERLGRILKSHRRAA